MEQLTAHLIIDNPALRETLLNLEGLKPFKVSSHINGSVPHFDILANQFNLILVEVTQALDEQLSDLSLSRNGCFIFLSEGLPLQNVDHIMRQGAGYHFRSPFDYDAINQAIRNFYHELYSPEESVAQSRSSNLDQFGLLVGSSEQMRQLFQLIHKISPTEASVFVTGESGVGKELVAQTLHLMSLRHDQAFVAINCGAINKELAESDFFGHRKGAFSGASEHRPGVFERADKGTLFLDEITEMPLETQVKLLRVLETGKITPVGAKSSKTVDVRIICACNRDPHHAIREGYLREDLFYRLSQFTLDVRPLRERDSDVIGLAQHFLTYLNEKHNTDTKLSEKAFERLAQYSWPGNVRELKSVIERSYLLSKGTITADKLFFEQVNSTNNSRPSNTDTKITVPAGIPLDKLEQQAIENTLKLNQGNKTKTAKQLKISLKTLYNKLEKYQI